jgi:hypothetical protein
VLLLSAVLLLPLERDQHLYSLKPLWAALLVLQLQQTIQLVSLPLEEPMAALALQQRVQLASLLVKEPTAASWHTPPAPRLRLLLVVFVSFAFSF